MGLIGTLLSKHLAYSDESVERAWQCIAQKIPRLAAKAASKVQVECSIPAAKLLGVLATLTAVFDRQDPSEEERAFAHAACTSLWKASDALVKQIPTAANKAADPMAGVVMLESATALVWACRPTAKDAKELAVFAANRNIASRRQQSASTAFGNAQDRALKALLERDAVDVSDEAFMSSLKPHMARVLAAAKSVTPDKESQRRRLRTSHRRRWPQYPRDATSLNNRTQTDAAQLELLGALARLLSDDEQDMGCISKPSLQRMFEYHHGLKGLLSLLECNATTQRRELKAALRALGAFAFCNKLDFEDLDKTHASHLLALIKMTNEDGDLDLQMAVVDFISNTAMRRRRVQELYRGTDGLLSSLVAATAMLQDGRTALKVLRAIVGVLYKCSDSEGLNSADAVTVVERVARACVGQSSLHARLVRLVAQLLASVQDNNFNSVFEMATTLCFSPCTKRVLDELKPTWKADMLAKGDSATPPLWPLQHYHNGTPRLIFEAAHKHHQAKATIYEAFPVLIGAYWAGTSGPDDSPALPFKVGENTERLFIFDLLCSAGLKPLLASRLLDASYEYWLERQTPLEMLHSLVVECLTPFPPLSSLASRLSKVLLTPLADALALYFQRSRLSTGPRAGGEIEVAEEEDDGEEAGTEPDSMAAVVASALTAPLAEPLGEGEDESDVDYWRRPLHDALHELLSNARQQPGSWVLQDTVTPSRAVVMPRPQDRQLTAPEQKCFDNCLAELTKKAGLDGQRLWFHGCTFGRAVQYTGDEISRRRGFEAFQATLGPEPLREQDLGRDPALYLSANVADAIVHKWEVIVDPSESSATDEDADLRAVLVFAVPDEYLDGLGKCLPLTNKDDFFAAVASSRIINMTNTSDMSVLGPLRETLLEATTTANGPFFGCAAEHLRAEAPDKKLPLMLKNAMRDFSDRIEEAPWALTWTAGTKRAKKAKKDIWWAWKDCVRPHCVENETAATAAASATAAGRGVQPASGSVAETLALLQQEDKWVCPQGHAQCRRRVQLAVRKVDEVDIWEDMWQRFVVGVIVLERQRGEE